MKIKLNQRIVLLNNGNCVDFKTITKEYKSNIIPHPGDRITDTLYKDPYEYKILDVILNYLDDECTINIESIMLEGTNIEILKKWIDLAQSCKWECRK